MLLILPYVLSHLSRMSSTPSNAACAAANPAHRECQAEAKARVCAQRVLSSTIQRHFPFDMWISLMDIKRLESTGEVSDTRYSRGGMIPGSYETGTRAEEADPSRCRRSALRGIRVSRRCTCRTCPVLYCRTDSRISLASSSRARLVVARCRARTGTSRPSRDR